MTTSSKFLAAETPEAFEAFEALRDSALQEMAMSDDFAHVSDAEIDGAVADACDA